MDYHFGSYRVDTIKRRVWRGDELIALTPKAFETLVVLVTRAGEVVEKDELLGAVWPDAVVEEGTVAQNISTLRRALGDTAETPTYIATVPRRGYRFLGPVTTVAAANASASPEQPLPPRLDAAPGISPVWKRRRWLVLALMGGTLAVTGIVVRWRPMAEPAIGPVVFAITPPDGTTLSSSGGLLAVAPDGRHVVFVARSLDGVDRLWVRAMDSLDVRVLPATEGSSQPFWSTDSRHVAFFADGKLKKADIESGPTEEICSTPQGATPLAGTWNARDDILFSAVGEGIYRVMPGTAAVSILLPVVPGDDFVGWPQFLPDGRHYLFVVGSTRPERTGIYVGSLDSRDATRVTATRSSAIYTASGHLLFVQDGTLVAQPFEPATARLHGVPLPIADRIAFNAGTARATFSVSRTGVLAYRKVTDTALAWFDRHGRYLGRVGSVGGYLQFAISPDGTRIAASRIDPQVGTSDIWIIDAEDGKERRLTFDSSWERDPLWTRDGTKIAFGCQRGGRWEIHEKAVDEGGPDRQLVASELSLTPEDWTPDGQLLYRELNRDARHDFCLVGPDGANRPSRVLSLGASENTGRVSPDGHWLAYLFYSPDPEVGIRSLASQGPVYRLSTYALGDPRWRGDGRELFYLSRDVALMAVDVQLTPAFKASPPQRLFQPQALAPSGVTGSTFDVTSDGQRFLVKTPAASSVITVVSDWSRMSAASR